MSAWAGALAKTIPATVERSKAGGVVTSLEAEVDCIGVEVWIDADQVVELMTLECPEAGFWQSSTSLYGKNLIRFTLVLNIRKSRK